MRTLTRFLARLRNSATRNTSNDRLREEIESHLASQTEENIRAGMTPRQARRHARLHFGPVEAIREHYHAEKTLPLFENLLLDIRYSLRVLRKSPAFTIVAVITLMLGIGANVVVFGVLNAVILHPLEVTDPQNLYQLRHQAWSQGRLLTTSYPAFLDIERRNTTFSGLIGINAYSHAALTWRNTVINISGDEVTGNYFDLLGVEPQAGRFFHAADEHGPNSAPYLVLSDTLWRSAFHADPAVIGTHVELNKHPFTILGVAPTHFHGTERFAWPDYWLPTVNQSQIEGYDSTQSRTSVAFTVIGRLKPGVTPQQATENLNAIAAQLAREYPQSDEGQPLRLIHPGLLGDDADVIRGFLWSVTALALLVLAAACANLASLFAARAADRSRELALRIALGSSRTRLLRQLLTEATLVSLLGGAAGLLSAYLLLRDLDRWHSPNYGHLEIAVDLRVYLVGLAITLASALLFAIIPARQAWQSSPLQTIKGNPDNSLRLSRLSLRDLLLGFQIAICTLLVTASLVAVRGMQRQLHAPMGFHPQGAMLIDLDLSQADLEPEGEQLKIRQIIEAARSLPGVTAAGSVNRTPMTGGLRGTPIFEPGTAEFKLKNAALAPYVFTISPGYLDAAGTRLLSGRDLSWHDDANSPHVALVNQTFAQKMARQGATSQTSAIGRRFILDGSLTEVVGIVEDGKYHDLAESPQPVVYLPIPQSDQSANIFAVRSQRTPSEMTAELQRALSNLAPNAPLSIITWSDSIAGELFPARAAAVALGVMGLLAAMLAVTGIFGMAAYSVSRRMKELGIRVALGARKPQIVSAAVGRPILLLAAGSALGLMAGISATHLLRHIVYQADPRDPLVLIGAIAAMILLGVIASWIPAQKALRVDPSSLMREE